MPPLTFYWSPPNVLLLFEPNVLLICYPNVLSMRSPNVLSTSEANVLWSGYPCVNRWERSSMISPSGVMLTNLLTELPRKSINDFLGTICRDCDLHRLYCRLTFYYRKRMVGSEGLEPSAYSLKVSYSTIELWSRFIVNWKLVGRARIELALEE